MIDKQGVAQRIILYSFYIIPPILHAVVSIIAELNEGSQLYGVYIVPGNRIENIFWFSILWPVLCSPCLVTAFHYPLFYKEEDGFYYRKLIRKKKIVPEIISHIKERSRISIMGSGYDIHIKGEYFPLPIRKRWDDLYPWFGEEILEEFPPEDFPPSGEKGDGAKAVEAEKGRNGKK